MLETGERYVKDRHEDIQACIAYPLLYYCSIVRYVFVSALFFADASLAHRISRAV